MVCRFCLRRAGGIGEGATETKVRTYHATVVVTRAEEWCVDAGSPDEAKELLLSGHGYRCHIGDVLHVEFERILDHE